MPLINGHKLNYDKGESSKCDDGGLGHNYLGQEHSLVGKILEHVGMKNYIFRF